MAGKSYRRFWGHIIKTSFGLIDISSIPAFVSLFNTYGFYYLILNAIIYGTNHINFALITEQH